MRGIHVDGAFEHFIKFKQIKRPVVVDGLKRATVSAIGFGLISHSEE